MKVFVEDLMESNCYVIESNHHGILIDPNESSELIPWLEQQDFQLDYIFLTHEHCDHISQVDKVREMFHAPVICSNACNIGIQDPRKNMSSILEVYLHFRGIDAVKCDELICQEADITFEDSMEMEWQQYTISMKRVPGHTIGSIIIYLKEKNGHTIAFTGDYLIPGERVITRLQSGDTKGYIEYGKKYLESLPAGLHVYPGHGKDYVLDKMGTWKEQL